MLNINKLETIFFIYKHRFRIELLRPLKVGSNFSNTSCVHISHACEKNIETFTVGFTGLEKLRQKIRHEIPGGVFRAIFDLRPHLVFDILNFESFVTRLTDIDATVKDNVIEIG